MNLHPLLIPRHSPRPRNHARYDAENHITKVDGGSTASYGYAVDGRRASRIVGGVETDYFYDLTGHPITEYGAGCGATCWARGTVYFNGQMIGEYANSTTYFVAADHLGSTRLLTGYPTASVVECDDYYPFGETINCGSTGATTHKFTGYERDTESNLDNAQARYYGSTLGRFMSPDPGCLATVNPADPQTWNRYAYVRNSPVELVDPTGEFIEGGGVAPLPPDPTAGAPTFTPDDLFNQFVSPFPALGGGVGGRVHQAIGRALEALKTPKCRGLFSHSIDPSALLVSLASGASGYGSITEKDLGFPSGPDQLATIAETKPSVEDGVNYLGNGIYMWQAMVGATITINTNASGPFSAGWPSGPSNQFPGLFAAYSNQDLNAMTILHELGHAANYIFGDGSSAIIDDSGSLFKSILNDIFVLNDCFGGPK